MEKFMWCPACKTTSLWLLDETGVYFEKEIYACTCGVVPDNLIDWDNIRKFVAGLPDSPERGMSYDFQYLSVKLSEETARRTSRYPVRAVSGLDTGGYRNDVRIIRLPEVMRLVGLGKSTIYEMIAKGTFPRPVSLGSRAVGWKAGDIWAWLLTRKAA